MKRFLVLCAALFTAIACNDSTGPGAVTSIAVDFPPAPIPVGSTYQLTSTPLDKDGNPAKGECVFTYTSSDQSVATVSSTGLITGIAEGTATITVETFGKTTSAVITVGNVAGPVNSITLVPPSITIAQGQTGQIYAILTDANGDDIPVLSPSVLPPFGRAARVPGASRQTNAPIAVNWASNNTAVARVDNSGKVTAVSQGSATITATAGGKTATAQVNVVASTNTVANIRIVPSKVTLGINSKAQLDAILTDANDVLLSGRTMTWSSNNTTIATVNPATGLVTGIAAGTATITVTSEGKSANATVVVSPTGQGSIFFNQSSISLKVGGTANVSVSVNDAAGNPINSPTVAYTTAAPTVATVVGAGASATVTGVAAGNTTLRAVTNGLTAEIPVSVTSIPVVSVSITPPAPNVAVGQTVQLKATAFGAGNVEIPGRVAEWSSSNDAVATVTPSGGLVRGRTVGNAVITATIDGVSKTVTVNVTPAQIVTIEFNPSSPINLAVGQSVDVGITLRDGAGNTVTGVNVDFRSRDVEIALATSNNDLLLPGGRVTGSNKGDIYVVATATSGGVTKTDSVLVKVSLVAAASLNVPVPAVCVPLGGTVQLVGTVLDAANHVLSGRPITWTVTNSTVGSISQNGLLTGLTSGVANVVATVEGVTQNVTVAICPPAVERVTLSPSTASVSVGGTVQLAATTYDGLNNVLTGRSVTYSTSNANVATVSASGLVTGVGLGNATITATSEGKTATTAVSVTNKPVSSISVSPSSLSMTLTGGNRQLAATTFDDLGNVLTGRPVTFTSNNLSVVTVSSNGLITPVGLGTTTITVSSGTATTNVSVTVANAPVATVELVGPATIVKLLWGSSGETYSVVTKDADGNVLTGRACTWSSSNPNVANVNLGQVTALGIGTSTLTVTCEGKSDSKNISVISILSL